MSLLGKLFSAPPEVYQALLNVYAAGGLSAQLLQKDDPAAYEHTLTIKVAGRYVELVTIHPKSGVSKGGGMSVGPSISKSSSSMKPKFSFYHIVRGLAGRNPADLKAELKPVTKGLISKQTVDLSWEGGRLAATLNSDSELKKQLLQQQASEVSVSADEKNDSVRIEYVAKVKDIVETKGFIVKETTTRFEELPPMGVFEICDKIAGYTKST